VSRKEDTAPNLATGQLADLILTEQEAAVQVILRTDEERRRLADNRRAIEKKERELNVERERQFLALTRIVHAFEAVTRVTGAEDQNLNQNLKTKAHELVNRAKEELEEKEKKQ